MMETELLILADGTIFAHNLTPAMAAVLSELSPGDLGIQLRAATQASSHIVRDVPGVSHPLSAGAAGTPEFTKTSCLS